MTTEANLEFFSNMVLCCHKMHLWSFDADMHLLSTNCTNTVFKENIFLTGGTAEIIQEFALSKHHPGIFSNEYCMYYIVAPEWQGEHLFRIHILGTAFIDTASVSEIRSKLISLRLSDPVLDSMEETISSFPVLSLNRIFEYAISLHYCCTLERITVSDLHYRSSQKMTNSNENDGVPTTAQEKHGTYALEQEMLRMVREGNLDYKKVIAKLAITGNIGKMANNNHLRQMKNAVLVSIILFSRAAMDGGLSPETAMSLTDRYMQSTENASDIGELSEINFMMQEDFVMRVHKLRASHFSSLTAACMDYIDAHIGEDIRLEKLALGINYSVSHISRTFKEDTGVGLRKYILKKKLGSAESLLKGSNLSVAEISGQLGFCSPSYFTESFRAEYGTTPSEWRNAAR